MFDDENQIICWFDTAAQAEAIGVPEGELDEFMLNVAGPISITERVYASPGRVKAVVIKHFGPDVTEAGLCSLRSFVRDFGLDFISRPRSGMSLDFNSGRYYSPGHDPARMH